MSLKKSHLSNLFITLVLFIIMALSSCSKKVLFVNNKNVPAARVFVKISTDGDNNYTIKIKIENLAEVERLMENKKNYVVWLETLELSAINIGQIQSSTKKFSNNLKADFSTVSARKPTRIFISAEENASVSFPGNLIVLTTPNF